MSSTKRQEGRAEIVRLVEVVRGEPDALARMEGCVAELRAVHGARSALAGVPPAELAAALRTRPGGGS